MNNDGNLELQRRDLVVTVNPERRACAEVAFGHELIHVSRVNVLAAVGVAQAFECGRRLAQRHGLAKVRFGRFVVRTRVNDRTQDLASAAASQIGAQVAKIVVLPSVLQRA